MKVQLEINLKKALNESLRKGFISKKKFNQEIKELDERKKYINNKKSLVNSGFHSFNGWLNKLKNK